MRIECLQRKNPADGKEILAGFLRSLMAVARYGRTTIYEGDTYYIPYTMVTYLVEETKEQYRFLLFYVLRKRFCSSGSQPFLRSIQT